MTNDQKIKWAEERGVDVSIIRRSAAKQIKDLKDMVPLYKKGGFDFDGDLDQFLASVNKSIDKGYFPGLQDLEPRHASDIMNMTYACGVWARTGHNVFNLTHDLAAAFAITDVDYSEDKFNFPYPSFFLRIPPGVVAFFSDSGAEWVTAIQVCKIVFDGVPHYYQHCVSECNESIYAFHTVESLIDGGTIPISVDRVGPGSEPVDNDSLTILGAARVVFNFCHWLESVGRRAGRHVSKRASKNDLTHWECGEGIVLRPEIKRMVTEMAMGVTRSVATRMRIRHIVRGHWKQQAVKEGTKRIFVQPYWRGPDGNEAWERVYEVSEGGQVNARG